MYTFVFLRMFLIGYCPMSERPPNYEGQDQGTEVNRVSRAEVLLRFLNVSENIAPLHGQKIETVFSDEEHKRQFIENLTPGEFIQLLDGLNGILRGKKIEDWKMDGDAVELSGVLLGTEYIPPRQEDKPQLLAEVLSSAKKLSQDGRDINDIALLISASLNAIHPYLDGNGRVSRLVYLLLTEGFDDNAKSELRSALNDDGRDKININPGLIQGKITDLIKMELGVGWTQESPPETVIGLWREHSDSGVVPIEFKEHVDEDKEKLFKSLFKNDNEYLFFAIYKFLENSPKKKEYTIGFPKFSRLSITRLSKDLGNVEIDGIIALYRRFKKEHIEKLVDCIVNPDKEEYGVDIDGQRATLKEFFENEIKEEHERRIIENAEDGEK